MKTGTEGPNKGTGPWHKTTQDWQYISMCAVKIDFIMTKNNDCHAFLPWKSFKNLLKSNKMLFYHLFVDIFV